MHVECNANYPKCGFRIKREQTQKAENRIMIISSNLFFLEINGVVIKQRLNF